MKIMPEQEEQKEIDPYLDSPKTFHLEMPLYHEISLEDLTIAKVVYDLLSHAGTIDAYCIWCDKDSVFDAQEHEYSTFGNWTQMEPGFRRNSYRCTRNTLHKYYIYFRKDQKTLLKVGQWPSVADFQIPQAQKYRKTLGEESYKELTRGIGLAANGVGIGSFVYLRRVFESLIEEAYAQAKEKTTEFDDQKYRQSRMDEKIRILRDFLPEFLVENRSLYSILSKGIHDLTEDECLKYFETVRIGIEQILDEKIEKSQKVQKASMARRVIQKLSGELTE